MTRKTGALLVLLALGAGTRGYGQEQELAPPTTFWQTLGDTTLARLVGEVVKSNHDVVAARARLNGARAARTQTALDFTPTVDATASYTRQRYASASFPGGSVGGTAFPDQTVWDAGLQLSWELDLFGRIRKATQGKNALVGAAEEDVRDLQVLLASELAINYFELRGEQDRLRVARKSAENQQHTLDVTVQRLEAGRGSEFDSERARTQLNSTLAAIPALEASVSAIEHRINVLVGREGTGGGLEQEGVEPPSLPALPDSILVPNPDIAVQRRPDVRSAGRQVAAGSAFVGAAKAEYLPRIMVGGAAGYVGNSLDALSNSNTPRYAIGPVISLPLNVGRVKAGVDQARAQEAEAEAYYRKTQLQAREEIATSVVAYNKARQSLDYLEAAAKASERAAALARLRFDEGASDLLQVLDAERTMLATQDRLAAGRTAATSGLVALYRALGGALQ